MKDKNMLNVMELTKYLSVSESTIRKLISQREIPFVRIYRKILFNKEVIDKWLDRDMTVMVGQVESYMPYFAGSHRRKNRGK